MPFEKTDSFRKYKIVKQHFYNDDPHQYWLFDAGKNTPYTVVCPVCKSSDFRIDFNSLEAEVYIDDLSILDEEELRQLGGSGSVYKIIRCLNCNNLFYIGIGYREPNNGRDVYLLKTIIEVKAK
ncbi:hypothetical protein WG947_09000 [Pontibacter sp. H259]|uniref:hypothetical protein n=1 Tax=Pontibacter sp. H259 TaxID=3133421 RepID=UPI0030BBF50A